MKFFNTSMNKMRIKSSNSKSKDKVFQLLLLIWLSNISVRIKSSTTSIKKARVKSFNFKSKDEIF